jgi:hypothetical protein
VEGEDEGVYLEAAIKANKAMLAEREEAED